MFPKKIFRNFFVKFCFKFFPLFIFLLKFFKIFHL
jgi:hypothetical protein